MTRAGAGRDAARSLPGQVGSREARLRQRAPAATALAVPCCACGGGCPRCKAPGLRELRIAPSDGDAEREAQRVAADPPARAPAAPERRSSPRLPGLLAHANTGLRVRPVDAAGEPIRAPERSLLEARLGHDFAEVRVHHDRRAAESASALRARAYTVGQHIVFGRDRYCPASSDGLALLSHELAHVAQNAAAGQAERTWIARSPLEPIDIDGFEPTIQVISAAQLEAPLLDPEAGFAEIKRATAGEQTTIRDPASLGKALLDFDDQPLLVPPGTELTLGEQRKAGGVAYVFVDWHDGQAWVRQRDLIDIHSAGVPAGTPVYVIEQQVVAGKTYARVSWSGAESVLNWIRADSIAGYDLRGTTLGDQERIAPELLLPNPQAPAKNKVKPDFAGKAPSTFISAQEIEKIRAVVATVSKERAYLRDPESGVSLAPAVVPMGLEVVVIEERTLEVDSQELVVSHVIDFDGREYWTSHSNLEPRDPRTKDAEGRPTGSLIDDLVNPAAKQALERYYQGQVDRLLAGKSFHVLQMEMLAHAEEFLASPKLQAAQPALAVPDRVRVEDGIVLSPDLISRVDLFYRFLEHAQLLVRPLDPELEMAGVRSYARAHELSTFYTLNPSQGFLSAPAARLELARQLVAIDGVDPNTPQPRRWASEQQIDALRSLVAIIDSGPVPATSGAAPLVGPDFGELLSRAAAEPFGPLVGQPEAEPVDAVAVEEAQAGIDAIVLAIQENHRVTTKPANPLAQGAQAAEGYPPGDLRRRPNIRDIGISNHCGGEAVDIHFAYRINYFDPVIDALALQFGLMRPAKDRLSEFWHYERIGVPLGQRVEGDDEMGP